MKTKPAIDQLWDQMRGFINAEYASTKNINTDEGGALRDYAENISWSDDLEKLLSIETANEKQHRGNRPTPKGFSSQTAAKLILMRNVADGSFMAAMPSALTFITLRKSAAEAQLIGYLIRHKATPEWAKLVREFDYSKIMQAA